MFFFFNATFIFALLVTLTVVYMLHVAFGWAIDPMVRVIERNPKTYWLTVVFIVAPAVALGAQWYSQN